MFSAILASEFRCKFHRSFLIHRSDLLPFGGGGLAQRKAYINGKIIACLIWAILL